MKKYMVIETFLPDCKRKVYERFHAQGRMLPDGLAYVNSWVEAEGDRCFQLMETNDPTLLTAWTDKWEDLVSFEVIEIGEKPKPNGSPSAPESWLKHHGGVFEILFERSAEAIWLHEVIDPRTAVLVDCNQAAVELIGAQSKQQLLNTRPDELSPPLQPD